MVTVGLCQLVFKTMVLGLTDRVLVFKDKVLGFKDVFFGVMYTVAQVQIRD